MYLVLSAFNSNPISLVATTKASALYLILLTILLEKRPKFKIASL
jgi:hypothetical protein